jgi:hypothetical protein
VFGSARLNVASRYSFARSHPFFLSPVGNDFIAISQQFPN